MMPQFERGGSPDEGELICPHCKNMQLHHREVEIFDREEDAKTGLHVHFANSSLKVDSNLAGNPSLRRDGVLIRFECECGGKSVLSIQQHKGSTYISIDPEV